MIRHAKGPYESCVRNGDGLRPGDEVCKDVCLGLTVSRGWSSAPQGRAGPRASVGPYVVTVRKCVSQLDHPHG